MGIYSFKSKMGELIEQGVFSLDGQGIDPLEGPLLGDTLDIVAYWIALEED